MITYYRLWDYLNRKDINKRELCNATGLSPATITKMVNNRYVSVETIDKICTFLEVQPSQIIEWQNKK